MDKIDPLFLAKTAEKPNPLRAHILIYTAYIKEYPSGEIAVLN